MFYLDYLFWLRSISHLVMLHSQIQNNNEFYQKLLLFFEHIMKYFAYQNLYLELLNLVYLDVNDSITIL